MMPTDDQQQAKLQQNWQEICDKLQELKKLDTGLLGEGARDHRYAFRPPASRDQIKAVEERLGVSLPAELAYFYSTIGDGGAGPCGGMAPIEKLSLFRLDDTDASDDELDIPPRRERLDAPDISAVTRLVEVTERGWTFYASGTDQVLVSCDGPTAGSVDWIGRVLGADMHPTFAERELVARYGRIDFGSSILQDRFCAARKRYLDSAVQVR